MHQRSRLVTEFNARGPACLLYTFTPEHVTSEPGHATITEPSAIMALDASRVDLSRLPPPSEPLRSAQWAIVDAASFDGRPTADHTVHPEADPRQATAALGERNFAAALARLSEKVRTAWAESTERG